MTKKTASFELEPEQRAIIIQVAKDHGETSKSAALRFIIDDWARRAAAENGIQMEAGEEQE